MATLTEQELNAPGGMATTDGGFQSAVPPNFNPTLSRPVQGPTNDKGAPVNAQMFGTPPTPDINSELNRIKTEALGIQDILNQRAADEQTIGQSFNSPEFDQGTEYIDTNLTDQEITDIEQRQLRLFQKEIDATNQVYDQLLNEARMEGQGRLGSQRAMAARGGLLGSDFGASQKQKVQAFNTDVNRAIQAERQAKIGTIMGNVRQAVLAEKAEKRQAKQQGAENYLEWLKGEATRKQNNINLAANAMLTQGLNPAEMDENELAAIAQEAGTTVENLRFQYQQLASQQAAATAKSDLETRKTEAEIAKIEADIKSGKLITLGEGTMLYNPETGETFKNPKTYAPKDGSSGFGGYSNTDEQTLLGGGWTQDQISQLSNGVREYGLSEVIAQEKKAGATEEQIKALQSVYGVDSESTNGITRESLATFYGVQDNEEVTGGFLGFGGSSGKSIIDSLMTEVELYRDAGYTDKEILKIILE